MPGVDVFSDLKTLTQVLLFFGFALSLVGTGLIISFVEGNDNSSLELPARPARVERYYACFFPLLWICSLMAVIFRRHSTLAMSVGLLVAIVAYAYPFQLLDTVRHVLDEDLTDIDSVRKLAAGGVSGYLGAFLSFLAPAYQHAYPSAVPRTVRIVTIGSILAAVTATALLMASKTSHFGGPPNGPIIRQIVWSISDMGIIIVFVFNVGVWAGLPPYMWLSAAFGASQGMATLADYFTAQDLINDYSDLNNYYSETDVNLLTAGTVIIWSTIVMLFIASNVHVVDRSSYLAI